MSEPSRLFDELVTVARMLGAEVRLESFSTHVTPGGGLCRLSGRALILIDREAPASLRIDALARALSRFELDEVYMTPEARETVELNVTPYEEGGRDGGEEDSRGAQPRLALPDRRRR